MTRFKDACFAALWLLVVGVSVYDGCWVLANRRVIGALERNPFGQLLLHANGGDVWLLLGVKTFGTLCAASVLLVCYWVRPTVGFIICAGVGLVQVWLLTHLLTA